MSKNFLLIYSVIATACTGTGLGSLLFADGRTAWTQFSTNYTAIKSTHVLQFAITGAAAAETVYLDSVSVVDVSLPSVQLLSNPSFENSTLEPVGWVMWCTSSCVGADDGGQIIVSGCQASSGNNCYRSQCDTGYDFLGQSFSATINTTYTISFWYHKTGGSAGKLYVDIK